MLLSKIIQQYKASVTREINSLQNNLPFQWQKSFYDHIIRNEKSLDKLRQYIKYNHLKWSSDIENIDSGSTNKNCKDYYEEIIGGMKKPTKSRR
jgi:putative transposase